MFFEDSRKLFFRPLNGKYREQIVECLREFYARLYGSTADYSRSYQREQVLEVFREALARAPMMDEEGTDEHAATTRGEREQATWVLNQLLEHAWLERQKDEATLQSTYGFTRYGRLFTQPMIEASGGRFRTRHRNTRNTRNALLSFLEGGEVYDLLDAFEFSERIIADFSDVISELDERKRELVKEVEAQQVVQRASDEFFDFMEKRFMPDLAIRLSADSVEKYRDEIHKLTKKARNKNKEFKTRAERELRRAAPELLHNRSQSLLLTILDGIDTRMHNASMIMLPALRNALHGFTRRADIIMRQLSFGGAHQANRLQQTCKVLSALKPEDQNVMLSRLGEATAVLKLALPDTDALRLHIGRRDRTVNSTVEQQSPADKATRKQLFINGALDLAFSFNTQAQKDYVVLALSQGHRVHSQNLPVSDARELLMSAHVIEIASAGSESSEFSFRVTPGEQQVRTEYFESSDEFIIELIERNNHAA